MQQPELPMKDVTPPKPVVQKGDKPGPHPLDAKPKPKETAAARKDRLKAEAGVKPKKSGTAVATVDPQAPKEIKSTLQVIAEISTNPNTRPEVAQMAWNMQKEMIADQRKMDFSTAFRALQKELPPIRRDGKITVPPKDGKTGYTTPYSTFNSIMEAIQPLLTKHGFELSFQTEPGAMPDRIVIRGFLTGYGHERSSAFPLPIDASGGKNNVQGWGSAQSYGKRYCTIALLNIISAAPEDRDTDGNPNKPTLKEAKGGGFVDVPDRALIDEEQQVRMRDLIEWCGVGEKKFFAHYGIAKLSQLPADLYAAAEKDCKDFHANQQRKK